MQYCDTYQIEMYAGIILNLKYSVFYLINIVKRKHAMHDVLFEIIQMKRYVKAQQNKPLGKLDYNTKIAKKNGIFRKLGPEVVQTA